MAKYYIIENSTKKGPYSLDELIMLDLSENTLVWRNGLKNWTELINLSEYKKTIPPPIPKTNIKEKYVIVTNNNIEQRKIINNSYEIDSKENLNHQNAGFWLRLIAFTIDSAFIMSFFIIYYWSTFHLPYLVNYENNILDDLIEFLSFLGIVFYWLYYAVFESSRFQGTLGKTILGLKVTNENFERINFGQASFRLFGKIFSALYVGIGFLMIGFTKRKQGWHDRVVKTLVVKENKTDFRKKLTLWIILVISLMFSLISIFFIENTEINLTIENKYSISIPSFLIKVNNLHDDASFQYQNAWKDFYVIVIDESKNEMQRTLEENDLTKSYQNSIDVYSQMILDVLKENINYSSQSELMDTTINNMPAKITTLKGEIEGISAFYSIGIYEGKKRYYLVLAWTSSSKEYSYKSEMNKILFSIRELN